MPLKTLRVAAFADVERELQQLGRALDALGGDDLRDAQVDLAEVVDRDDRRDRPRRRVRSISSTAGAAGSNSASSSLRVDALHQVLVVPIACALRQRRQHRSKRSRLDAEELRSTCAASAGSDRLQVEREERNASMQVAADLVQLARACSGLLASSQGLCWSKYSLTRSASAMISRSALPNSRSS